MLLNHRHQRAVGQGFFHTAQLGVRGGAHLHYVYDCGSMQKYAHHRNARIDEYLNEMGAGSQLDLLYISHAHADHLNGLPRLLHKSSGLRIDTIMMPLIGVEDRLIAFARTAAVDRQSLKGQFYRDFIADPLSAVGRFGPRQVLVVEPGNRDDGAPGPDDPRPPEGGEDLSGPRGEHGGPIWKLVGKGTIKQGDVQINEKAGVSGTCISVVPDTAAIYIPSTQHQISWLLAPFVDPGTTSLKYKFMGILAKKRGITRRKLRAWLDRVDNLKSLLNNHVAELRNAYREISDDINITSLCLYSGPKPPIAPANTRLISYSFGDWVANQNSRIGWLATGDASLRNGKRCAEFLLHYQNLSDQVVTLTMPHHGADSSFNQKLLTNVNPTFCVAAADLIRNWKHPGPETIQTVASHGLFLQVVTSAERSEVRERAWLM